MGYLIAQKRASPELTLADGFGWRFHAVDEQSIPLISTLSQAMRLSEKAAPASEFSAKRRTKQISVRVSENEAYWADLPAESPAVISCNLGPISAPEKMAFQLIRVAQIVAHFSETNGGLLIHGALAELRGHGVILAGSGGAGKTTASNRLPKPWTSLCDDVTLIVRNAKGQFWAHPWPTWSRYSQGNFSKTWDVQHAVRLEAIFFLQKSPVNCIAPIGKLQAISQLVDVSHQATWPMAMGMNWNGVRQLRLQRFHNAIEIGNKVHTYRLELSLNGQFWKEIESFLKSLKTVERSKR